MAWAAGKLWVGGGTHRKTGTPSFLKQKGAGAAAGAEVAHREGRGWSAETGQRGLWLPRPG